MKNRIAWKLALYFAVLLLLFSTVIGGVFASLFKTHTLELYQADMEKRAVAIASSLSELMNDDQWGRMMMGRTPGLGTYLQYLDEIAMSDVWIVDEDMTLLMIGHMASRSYTYGDLPSNLGDIVARVFDGAITHSEGFSSLLETPTLTVGAPIESGGRVIGALLLHAPIEGMDAALSQGYGILASSLLVALAFSILLSILLAYTFTKPLNKMKRTAMDLAAGTYSVRTGVRQNDEVGDLATAIDTLSVRLEDASQESAKLEALRREFVSNVSHELRTPVTVLRGSLEALCDGVVADPAKVAEYHRQMLRESRVLERLVNDLLDLSRLQNLDFAIERSELDLKEAVRDAVRSASHLGAPRRIEIRLQEAEGTLDVPGDYGRLRQLFLILLDNAVKFSPDGGTVEVRTDPEGVSVTDHGPGISAADLPYIFDRFYKVDSEENKAGTGLGLAIARQIADRHGFSLSADSRVGGPTTFRLDALR